MIKGEWSRSPLPTSRILLNHAPRWSLVNNPGRYYDRTVDITTVLSNARIWLVRLSFSWLTNAGMALGSLLALGMGIGCGGADQHWVPDGTPEALVTTVDTLSTPREFLLADPIGVYQDRHMRYVAVDRSDKNLKVYDRQGRFSMTVGAPGEGPGEFEVLWGGGVTLGDSLYGYDFVDLALQLYAPDGSYGRTHPVGGGHMVPSDVTSFGETSFLVTYFPLGAHHEDLLQVVGIDGATGPRFMNLSGYFTPESPALLQHSVLLASGRDDLIVAGMVGYDTIMAFDGEGDMINKIRLPEDVVTTTYKQAFSANSGFSQYEDGTYVVDGIPAVHKIVVLSDRLALVQVTSTTGGDPFVDLSRSGQFVAVFVDRATNSLWAGSVGHWEWGLLGGVNKSGHAIVGRYIGNDYESVEIGLMRIEVTKGGGE